MVKKITYVPKKHFTYKLHNLFDHIESKTFHMIKNTSQEIEGQLLSSLHYNIEIPVNKDIDFVLVKYNSDNIRTYEFKTTISSNKLISSYNELFKKSTKQTDIFMTSLCHLDKDHKHGYSMYIDFQVYQSNPQKDGYICLTLPSFKVYKY